MIKNDEDFKYIFDNNMLSTHDNRTIISTLDDILMYLFPNAQITFTEIDDESYYYKIYKYSIINKDKKYEFRFIPNMNVIVTLAIEDFKDMNNTNISKLKRITLSRLPEYLDVKKRHSLLPKHIKYHINDLFILRLSNYNKIRSELFKIVDYIFNGERGLTYRSRSKLYYVIQNVRDGKKFKCHEKTLQGRLCEGV
jgi:hypothetical protein